MNGSISDINDDPQRPTRLADVNVNEVVPPKYTYPVKYWFKSPPDRELSWLLDEGRLDDAVVYFLTELGPSFAKEMPFVMWQADPDALIGRLWEEERIRVYSKSKRSNRRPNYERDVLVLGPKSSIDQIVEDVEFLQEPANPAYRL
jgi:hypothetical protein